MFNINVIIFILCLVSICQVCKRKETVIYEADLVQYTAKATKLYTEHSITASTVWLLISVTTNQWTNQCLQ